ncbi:hypothetical protein DRQ00_03520 [candidate division KSB1 bacterium]|nr:MAG: hypothetical protein DRQ12_04140 [candidate division KSB1 bacterium]RKY79472.1 MAG: hypothetical protein DRQ00_03520 [candidate division KSB1 bacterium]RKY84291.1 MAG: hypothetical protein DRQ11_11775 [candidate division KSB1 bacterium]
MEVLTLLVIGLAFLLSIKLLALLFKTGIFILALPLQIFAALILTIIFLVLVPIGVITGILTVVLSPLLFLGPLLPILLVALGIYLLLRR